MRAARGDFFMWAVREGRRPDNPVDRVPKLRPTPEPVYDLWRQDELDLLVAGTRKLENPLRERLRVPTMIETGCPGGRAPRLAARRLRPLPGRRSPCSARPQETPDPGVGGTDEHGRRVHADRLPAPRAVAGRQRLPVVRRLPRGERVIGLKPERSLSYRGFGEWWRRVRRRPVSAIASRTGQATRLRLTCWTRPRATCTPSRSSLATRPRG